MHIRICPDWNVKEEGSFIAWKKAEIRICPDWNVKCKGG